MKRIRVLHVIQNLNYGGMERLIAHMVRLGDKERFEFHIMVLQYFGRFSKGLESYAALHRAPRLAPWSLLYPRELAVAFRAIAPDVVHTHSGVWLKGARAARMAGVPLIIHTEHGRRAPDPLLDRITDMLAARHSDRVVAVSDVLAAQLIRTVRVPPQKVCVIINGVEVPMSQPVRASGGLREELGIAPGAHVIASVGRLEPIKGYEVAVRALAHLSHPTAVLVVAGDGSQRARLDQLARELEIQQRVFLLGWRDDIERLHATADVFTMSSHSEGTSVSLLEALASGLCPVVTDVGGNREVLGSSLEHRLVPPGDPEALAHAWAAALADAGPRHADGQRAHARVRAHFSVHNMVAAYEQLYSQLSARSAGHRAAV